MSTWKILSLICFSLFLTFLFVPVRGYNEQYFSLEVYTSFYWQLSPVHRVLSSMQGSKNTAWNREMQSLPSWLPFCQFPAWEVAINYHHDFEVSNSGCPFLTVSGLQNIDNLMRRKQGTYFRVQSVYNSLPLSHPNSPYSRLLAVTLNKNTTFQATVAWTKCCHFATQSSPCQLQNFRNETKRISFFRWLDFNIYIWKLEMTMSFSVWTRD